MTPVRSAQAKSLPTLSPLQPVVPGLVTWVSTFWSRVLPVPSRPLLPVPQQYTLPPFGIAQVNEDPACTETQDVVPEGSATSAGDSTSAPVVPLPSCP